MEALYYDMVKKSQYNNHITTWNLTYDHIRLYDNILIIMNINVKYKK